MLHWLRLLRISALPSAISNVLVGFLIVHQSWEPTGQLWLLIVASSCLYLAGMVSNDVFDFSHDQQQRPHRPLPSGAISVSAATAAYTLLMGVAAVCGMFAGVTAISIVAAIIVCIFLYNGLLKQTPLAPVFMGACRSLNILLGASTVTGGISGFPTMLWWVAVSVGVLIAGLTWFASKETQTNTRSRLAGAGIVIGGGILLLAITGYATQTTDSYFDIHKFAVLILFICFPAIARIFNAISKPEPGHIQAAVISLLRSLILLDAAVCFLVSPNQLVYSICVVALLFPALILSRLIPPT